MCFLLPGNLIHKFAFCMFLPRSQFGSRKFWKFCTGIWGITLFLFGTVELAERCVPHYPLGLHLHVPGLWSWGPVHAGQKLQQRSLQVKESAAWGLCRPARCSRLPWAASHRGQTLAGARGSWTPLFSRLVDGEGDLQTVQPRRRVGSPTLQGSRQETVLLWTFSAPAFRRSMVLLFTGVKKLCYATMVGPRLSTGTRVGFLQESRCVHQCSDCAGERR